MEWTGGRGQEGRGGEDPEKFLRTGPATMQSLISADGGETIDAQMWSIFVAKWCAKLLADN